MRPIFLLLPVAIALIASNGAFGQEAPERRYPEVSTYYQDTDDCPLFFWLGSEGVDLLQQCRMAVGTERMAFWTTLGFFVAFVGVILLIFTVYYTRKAASSSDRMLTLASETHQLNDIAHKTELRAYISIEKLQLEVSRGASFKDKNNLIWFFITIKNVGQTPANNLSVDFQIDSSIADEDHRLGYVEPEFDSEEWSAPKLVSKGESITVHSCTIVDKSFWPGIHNDSLRPWARIKVRYEDVFGRSIVLTKAGSIQLSTMCLTKTKETSDIEVNEYQAKNNGETISTNVD